MCLLLLAPQTPTINLIDVSKNSLNFTWNEYQHCSNDSVLIEYEYEVRLGRYSYYGSTLIYSGSETNTTFISFNNLTPDTAYTCKVRVSITNSLTGRGASSYWSNVNARTTPEPELDTGPEFGTSLFYINVFKFCC